MYEIIIALLFALCLDFAFGDPKNKYHPTAWIGKLVAKLVTFGKCNFAKNEKTWGVLLVLVVTSSVALPLIIFQYGNFFETYEIYGVIFSVIVTGILLKTTFAIRGMQNHASEIIKALSKNNITEAQTSLAKIVKRDTKNLDKNHILSGILESISENIVDGITSPLFYFAFFGLPGAFVFRAVNTIDSMIGYKTRMFQDIGWFGANCDKNLNYIPARLTGFFIVISSMVLGYDWKNSYKIMRRDSSSLTSPNAGYPMAAFAGAFKTKFEKINHYQIGESNFELTDMHVEKAFKLMKVTSILFVGVFTIPVILILSFLGWWLFV